MMLIPYEPFHDGYDALRRAVKREQIAYEGRNKLAEYRKARGQRRRELMTELLHLERELEAFDEVQPPP